MARDTASSARPGRPAIRPPGWTGGRVEAYLTNHEKAAVEAAAKEAGMSTTAWVRQAVLSTLPTEPEPGA